MSDYFHERHFTVEEARRTLREILPALTQIVELKHALDAKGFDVYRHQYFGGMGPNGQKYFPQELEELVRAARLLDERGVVIKSVDSGLIDFPHLRANGEEVYLCFQYGEPEIEFWHTMQEGFPGRRPLDTL